jgi:hypothetical protein
VRPAPLILLDITVQASLEVPRWIVADDVGIMKFNVCTALRTAMSTHVAEIFRDAGPKVILYRIITLKPHTTSVAGETGVGNRSTHQGSPRKIG